MEMKVILSDPNPRAPFGHPGLQMSRPLRGLNKKQKDAAANRNL